MKKILALTLALIMVMSMTACGGKTEPETNETAAASGGAQTGGETEPRGTETTEAEKPALSGEITAGQLMNYPESPEEDFVVFGDEESGRSIESYEGHDEIVVIPSEIKGVPVTSIGNGVFSNGSPVKAVKIPDTVTEISESVFALNTNLEVVVFGKNVKRVEGGVLQNCTHLRELVLNDGLEYLGPVFAGGCTSLNSLEVPASVEEFHPMVFFGNPPEFIIIGEAGSAAEQFAADNGFAFEGKK